jgi:hypothetical protein
MVVVVTSLFGAGCDRETSDQATQTGSVSHDMKDMSKELEICFQFSIAKCVRVHVAVFLAASLFSHGITGSPSTEKTMRILMRISSDFRQ